MYDLDIKPSADKIFKKLAKKNKKQLQIIHKKVLEIRNHPDHTYKHLHKPLEEFYGIHIDTHFVLIFQIDHAEKVVIINYFGHHDTIYKGKQGMN